MLWVYYSSLILFFGAEFTQVYASQSGVIPADNAEPLGTSGTRKSLPPEMRTGIRTGARFVSRFGIDVADPLSRRHSGSVRPVKASELSEPVEDRDEPQDAQPWDISDPKAITSLQIQSIGLTGIFLLLMLYTLKLASAFFIPVVLAMLLSFLFASTIRTLERLWVPPPLGAVIVVGCLVGTVGVGIYRLALPARDWMGKLPEAARQIDSRLKGVKQSIREVTKAGQEVDRLTQFDTGEKIQKVEVLKPSLGESLLEPTQDFLVGAGIVLILLFFLLASGDLFLRKLVTVLPRFEDKKAAVEISHQIEHDISKYLFAITVVNALFGTSVGIAMYFLGIPNPLLWGVMAGLLHFIPFLGGVIGISIVSVVAAVTFDGSARSCSYRRPISL